MMVNLSFFVMMGQVLGASIPPMLLPLVKDMHVSSTKISQLASWGTLCIGLGVSTMKHFRNTFEFHWR